MIIFEAFQGFENFYIKTTTRRGFIEQKQHLRIRSQQCQTDRGKAMGLGVAGVSSPFLV